jgi:UDP-N-acetylglucosamine--N-acetylmuramyl-(pentapeptide) pyrophosphoryl-undecaprenol N-acetylglucosamine transferase
MRLIIAGGGTGGHLFPGIAVAEEFLSRDPANEVLFVGTEQGIEARLLPRLGYRLELIGAAGIRGKGGLAQVKGLAMMLNAYAQSRRILKGFKPDLVLGVGGYASGPLVLAARGLQIPRFIHEQNAIPGMTNRILARIADRIFVSLEEATRHFGSSRTLVTGNPLRKSIREGLTALHPATDGRFHLLIFGGSLGAHSINLAMIEAAPYLAPVADQLVIRHQTGEKDTKEVISAYASTGLQAEVTPFIDDMATAYGQADLVICRAGATTIAEVTASGKACLFIPFPHATDDHQRKNAEALLKKGAGFMLTERELTGEHLASMVRELMKDRQTLALTASSARSLGRTDAAQVIVDEMVGHR